MSGSELLSKQRRYNIGEYKNLNRLTANTVTLDYLNFGIYTSNVTITYPEDLTNNGYTLVLPNRSGVSGEFLGLDDNNKLKWGNPNVINNVQFRYGTGLNTSVIDSTYTKGQIIFPENYEITITPTSTTSKLLIQFRCTYIASLSADTAITFYIYKTINNVRTEVQVEANLGPLNATGTNRSQYVTATVIESGTTDPIKISIAFGFNNIIDIAGQVGKIGILGEYDYSGFNPLGGYSGYKNSIMITDFEGSGAYSTLLSKSHDNESIYYNLGTLFLGSNFNSLNTNNTSSLSLKAQDGISAPLFIGHLQGNVTGNYVITDNITCLNLTSNIIDTNILNSNIITTDKLEANIFTTNTLTSNIITSNMIHTYDISINNSLKTKDLDVYGNLHVHGTQTIVNSEILNIDDNIIVVNADGNEETHAGLQANIDGNFYDLFFDVGLNSWSIYDKNLHLNKLFGNNISLTENITAQWFNGNINSNFVNVSGNININDNYILDVSAIKFSDGTFFNNNIFNENIDSINSNISTLQTEMNAVEGNITLLQGNVSTLHNEMNAVEGNITLLQGNVSTLHNEMNAIEGNITLLQGNVSTLHNNTHQNVWSTHVSDDRLKHNEEPLDDALSLVRQLDVQTYDQTKIVLDADYNGDLSGIEHSRRHGVIAQELELVAPHLVHTITYHGYDISGVPNDLKGVDYFSLVGHCLRAIQQLDEKNLQQEETITNQTNEINPLKEKNLKLENKVDNLHIMMRNDKGNTGQHRCIANKFLEGNLYFGLIVCAKKNRYINFNNKLNITINENLPEVSLSEKENDISVFGVISTGEDIHNSREYSIETYTSIFYKTTSNENRLIINSLGEGGIWVSNKNGTLLSGHYITSSSIKGYGQKQNEGNLSNYTVAKITCDCEFTLVKKEKKKIKMKDVIVNEYNLKEYIYDNNGNLQYDNDLDENGNIQYDYEYDTRFLDENANILSGEEEYLSRLNNGENVYIACFVGCTYHCG